MSKRVVLERLPSTSGYLEEFRVLDITDGPLKMNEVVSVRIQDPEPLQFHSEGVVVWHREFSHEGRIHWIPEACMTPDEAKVLLHFYRNEAAFLTPRWVLR